MGVSDFTKYLVFLALNVAISTCGAILWAFGAILQRDEDKGVKNFSQLSIGGFSIGMGVLVFTAGCYGCYALFKRKSYLLTSYAILVIILFVIQIVLGAIALGMVNHSKCEMDEDMEKAVKELFMKPDAASIKSINSVQKTFRCCGVNGPSWWRQLQRPYPLSCCQDQHQPCERPYEVGCADAYPKALEKNVSVIGGVAIGFSAVEIVSAILAWYVRLSIKEADYM